MCEFLCLAKKVSESCLPIISPILHTLWWLLCSDQYKTLCISCMTSCICCKWIDLISIMAIVSFLFTPIFWLTQQKEIVPYFHIQYAPDEYWLKCSGNNKKNKFNSTNNSWKSTHLSSSSMNRVTSRLGWSMLLTTFYSYIKIM